MLYVGKATENDFKPIGTDVVTVEGQIEHARTVFEDVTRRANPASFWGFAECASKAIQPNAQNLCNVAWSNICRVGEIEGPPKGDLLREQGKLAVDTLRAELTTLAPDAVLFVCNHDGNGVIGEIYEDRTQAKWFRSDDEAQFGVKDVWWRPKFGGLPATVWMRHPQGAPPETRTYALMKLVSLL